MNHKKNLGRNTILGLELWMAGVSLCPAPFPLAGEGKRYNTAK